MAPTRMPTPQEREERCSELMPLIQAGDQDAFAEFVILTKNRLLVEMTFRGLLGQLDREDTLQRIYLEFWKARRHVWPEKAVGYLIRIATPLITGTVKVLSLQQTFASPVRDDEMWKYLGRSKAPNPEQVLLQAEAVREARDNCRKIMAAVPDHLKPALTAYVKDLSPDHAARFLGLHVYQVWDMTLEALAAARKAARVPVVNRELEEQMKECSLWPVGARPLPVDLGAIVRRFPVGQRTIIYCKLMGMNLGETARLMGVANLKSLGHIVRQKLARLAECFGVVDSEGDLLPLSDARFILHMDPTALLVAARGAGIQTAIAGGQVAFHLQDFRALWAVVAKLPTYHSGKQPKGRTNTRTLQYAMGAD